MPKRNPIQAKDLDYERGIKESDFCKSKVEILERGLKKGMSLDIACDLAQLNVDKVEEWRNKYKRFDVMIKWAKAVFKETLYDSLYEKMGENATTAIRFFSELRKAEKDALEQENKEEEKEKEKEVEEKEVSVTDALFNTLNELAEEEKDD